MASSGPGAWFLSRVLHRLDRGLMRLSGGRLMLSELVVGVPTILITTTGARSGQLRTLPLVAVPDGERLLLVASNWGGERNPGWYYNLKANPACEAVVEGERRQYVARELEGEERKRAWKRAMAVYPGYRAYRQRAAQRTIPVMALEPA